MAVFISSSADFDALVKRLVEVADSGREQIGGGLIAQWSRPVVVVVPSLEMGEYLRQAVSRQKGVAVNYEFTTLEKFLTTQIDEAAPDSLAILNREVMQTLLLGRFSDGNPLPAPVQAYLDSSAEAALDKRRYQLAHKVATVFEEYIFSRRELLDAWEAGEYHFADEYRRVAEIESWQAQLWRELIDGCDYLPIPKAFERIKAKVVSQLLEATTGTIHFVGFAGFGKEYLKMLTDLGDSELSIHLYFSSPTGCDLSALGEGGEELHLALGAWAKVGGDTLTELVELGGERCEYLKVDEENRPRAKGEPANLLHALQRAIDLGEATAADTSLAVAKTHRERGLSFLECPGIRREVEVVANEIWKLMGADKTLRFSDIAVVLPQDKSESYLTHIESVFPEFESLPFKINGLNLRGRSAVLDAVELLLSLPFGEFRRQELLALLVHPNFASRYRDIDDATWVDWADRLNILYGADRAHQTRRGSYLTSDLFNWDQGMKRLALGSFLQVDDAPNNGEIGVGEFEYLPENMSPSEIDTASALNASVTSLIDDMRWVRHEDQAHRQDRTLQQWAHIMTALVETYLVASTDEDGDYEEDIIALHRINESLAELAELPPIGEVSYETAYLYALDRLAKIKAPGGQRLTEGVIVSTSQRLRALPFEHIFVLGAGEGIFPARDPRSELDLRLQQPQRGDILPSERDKYHFLEILQAARQSLAISWVGREASTGEALPPSSIVSDLRRMVPVDRVVPQGSEISELDKLTVIHPLRRYSNDYDFRALIGGEARKLGSNYHPEAFEEARMRALRELLVEYNDDLRGQTVWTGRAFREVQKKIYEARQKARAEEQEDKIWPDWRARRFGLRLIEPRGTEAHDLKLPDTISISKLASFLKSPLQARAKTAIRIYDDEEDTLARERESFEVEYLFKHIVAKNTFNLIADESLESFIDSEKIEGLVAAKIPEAIDAQYRPGDAPVGPFEDVIVEKLVISIGNICNNLNRFFTEKLEFQLDEGISRINFSWRAEKAGAQPAPVVSFPSTNDSTEIRIVGTTPHMTSDGRAFISVKPSASVKISDHMKAYIAHLVLSAVGGDFSDRTRKSAVVPSNGWSGGGPQDKTWRKLVVTFAPINMEEAREKLGQLLNALLFQSPELLPVEIIEQVVKDGCDDSETWLKTIEKDSSNNGIRTQHGPVRDYLTYPPPEDPVAVVKERFAYFEKIVGTANEEGQ